MGQADVTQRMAFHMTPRGKLSDNKKADFVYEQSFSIREEKLVVVVRIRK